VPPPNCSFPLLLVSSNRDCVNSAHSRESLQVVERRGIVLIKFVLRVAYAPSHGLPLPLGAVFKPRAGPQLVQAA